MKKVLFVLGAFAAISLTACSGKVDCACDILIDNESQLEGVLLDASEFDGDCKDVKWADLDNAAWHNGATTFPSAVLKCTEK